MEELLELLTQSPDISSINLEFQEIEDFEELYGTLIQFNALQELHLHGNRIQELPKDLSSLSNLLYLDLSNNLVTYQGVTQGLRSLPALSHLLITLPDDELQQLSQDLPYIESINNRPRAEFIKGNPLQASSRTQLLMRNDSGLSHGDLNVVALLYDEILKNYKGSQSIEEQIKEFEEGVQDVMRNLIDQLQNQDPSPLTQSIIIKAKFDLFKLCFGKVLTAIRSLDPQLAKITESCFKYSGNLIGEMLEVMATHHPRYIKEIQKLHEQVASANAETAEVLEAAEQIEKEGREYEGDLQRLKNENEELKAELQSLSEENAKYLEMIIKQSKTNADNILSQSRIEPTRPKSRPTTSVQSVSQVKSLSLRQLKEVIDEIYVSKEKYDKRCIDGRLPKETMEQHMYTFLNQKYGLKNLILDWASSIINAVKRFSADDNDVAVFGRILRNECEEEFRFVQTQVKETVIELLKMHLQGKNPLKSSADIQNLLKQKVSGQITEEEWIDIVRYMYNETDAELLLGLIRDVINRKSQSQQTASRQRMTREEQIAFREKMKRTRGKILYKDFLKVTPTQILLDFQLKGHEKFLSKFLTLYRNVDRDQDGVINENEFRELVMSMDMGLDEDDIVRLLQIVDPFDHKILTFSTAVDLFTAERVPLDSTTPENLVAILQKLSFRDKQS